jgi:hypothetical protein
MKTTQYLGEERVRQLIRDKIGGERWRQSKLAEKFECSTNLISLMLTGRRNLNDEILSFVGYEKVVMYRKKVENKDVTDAE